MKTYKYLIQDRPIIGLREFLIILGSRLIYSQIFSSSKTSFNDILIPDGIGYKVVRNGRELVVSRPTCRRIDEILRRHSMEVAIAEMLASQEAE